jgi:hypothetical protein
VDSTVELDWLSVFRDRSEEVVSCSSTAGISNAEVGGIGMYHVRCVVSDFGVRMSLAGYVSLNQLLKYLFIV